MLSNLKSLEPLTGLMLSQLCKECSYWHHSQPFTEYSFQPVAFSLKNLTDGIFDSNELNI